MINKKPRNPKVDLALGIFFALASAATFGATALGSVCIFTSVAATVVPEAKSERYFQDNEIKAWGTMAMSLATTIVLTSPFWAFANALKHKGEWHQEEYEKTLPPAFTFNPPLNSDKLDQ